MAVIQLHKVSKQYGSIVALDNITLQVEKGEIFGIVGPNGAGKTTLIEIIEGLRTADSGDTTLLGMDIRKHKEAIKQRIGVVLQSTSIPAKAKVKEIFDLFASFYDRPADLKQTARLLGLEDKQNVYFKSLSGGWKQRVSLALALINDPDILFLDEPSMGLDPNARKEMWELILQLRNEGRTIIVTTHYMEEAETLCDRVAIIDKGQLVALDTPKKLISLLGSKKRICFKTNVLATKESLSTLSHIEDIEIDCECTKLHSSDLDLTLRDLFQLASEDNWIVSELRLEDANMTDVFNQLTLQGRIPV